MIKKITFLIFIFSSLFGSAQTDSIQTKRSYWFSAGINAGASTNFNHINSKQNYTSYWLANFKAIAPGNNYLQSDFTNLDTIIGDKNGNFCMNIFASFLLPQKNKKAFDISLKGNIIFNTKQRESLRFYQRDTNFVYDPSIDSTFKYLNHYNFEFKGSNIGIEISPTFYYNKLKRLNPYFGISFGIAYSYSNQLIGRYNPYGNIYDRGEWFSRPLNAHTTIETTRLKNNFSYYVSIPFGLELKRYHKPTWITPFVDFRYGLKFEKYPTPKYQMIQSLYTQVGLKLNFYRKNK